jgi:hypothetical protein
MRDKPKYPIIKNRRMIKNLSLRHLIFSSHSCVFVSYKIYPTPLPELRIRSFTLCAVSFLPPPSLVDAFKKTLHVGYFFTNNARALPVRACVAGRNGTQRLCRVRFVYLWPLSTLQWFKPHRRLVLMGEGEPPKVGEPRRGAPRFWLKKWLKRRLAPKKTGKFTRIINILQIHPAGHPSRFRRSSVTISQVIRHDFLSESPQSAGQTSQFLWVTSF